MRITVISSSLRRNSNSETLADEFIRGAKESGNEVEKITLGGKKINFCIGCLSCQKTGRCVIKDDCAEINEKIHDAEVLVFATPIYYYEMSGQLKTVLDRANPLYGSDYRFKDVYVLSTAAEDGEYVPKRAEEGVCGWIDCFERARLAGTVFVGGVNAPGDIKGNAGLQKAYELGKSIK